MTQQGIFAIFLCFFAYLVGSIPFGYVLGKLCGVGDIRKMGSGNTGATNMLRTGHKVLAALTLLLDMGKGFLVVKFIDNIEIYAPSFGGGGLNITGPLTYIAGVVVVFGHIFSIWLDFKGGKGVATALGVYFALSPVAGGLVAALWLGTFYRTRYSSFASVVSIGASPLAGLLLHNTNFALAALAIAAQVILRHRENITRLLDGKEHRWVSKKKEKDDAS